MNGPSPLRLRLAAWLLLALAGGVLQCRDIDIRVEPRGIFGTQRLEFVLGQDGVTPTPFSPTVTLWTFGDTLLGSRKTAVSAAASFQERNEITDFISNSLAFSERVTAANIEHLHFTYYRRGGRVAPFLVPQKGEDPKRIRFWPVDGIRIANRVYVYYMKIHLTQLPPAPFGFTMAGTGLARWDVPETWRPGDPLQFVRLPDLFGPTVPAFGDAVLPRGEWLYVVGRITRGTCRTSIQITRVRPQNIARPAAYEFLRRDGTWCSEPAQAADFLTDVVGECSLSYNEWLSCYVILYCSTAGEIVMVRFSDFAQLAGARREVIYRPPPPAAGAAAVPFYAGKEIHAEGNTIWAIYIDASDYQPHLLRIVMKRPSAGRPTAGGAS